MISFDPTEPLVSYQLLNYKCLLKGFLDRGYTFAKFTDDIGERTVVLRHDVDLSPERALRMAEIEADLGVESTYFFLLTGPLYNVFESSVREVLVDIEKLGHRVGVHFSTHQYWPDTTPSDVALSGRVEWEQGVLGAIPDELSPIISFHIPPEWIINEEFDGFIHTYETRFISAMSYRADSTNRWMDEPPLPDGWPDRIQVLTHPGLWGNEHHSFEEAVRRAREVATNRIHEMTESQYLD